MDTNDFLKLLGQSGAIGALILLLGKVLLKAFDRLIVAIDKLGDRIGKIEDAVHEHTAKDLEHHAEVQATILRVESRVDTALDLTPIREQRAYKTPPQGVGIYRLDTRKGEK